MAVAFVAATSADGNSNSVTFSHTVSTGSNRLLLAGGAIRGAPGVAGATFNGGGMSEVATQDDVTNTGNARRSAAMYKLVAPAETTADVVVSFDASNNIGAWAMSFTGVDQTTPTGTPAVETVGSSTTEIGESFGSATDDLGVDVLAGSSGGSTPDGSQVERAEDQNNLLWIHGSTVAAGASSTTMGWNSMGTGSGKSWIGVAVKAAGAGGPTPTRGRISWAELQAPFLATRGRVSWAELQVPFLATRGRISFAELEAPTALTRGRVSWAELEVPFLATRGRISWAELQVPLVGTRGRISFAELEAPTVLTRGRVSFAELEVPGGEATPTRGRIAWAELEMPLVGTRGRISWAELETPFAPTRGRVSWAEFEVPTTLTRGRVSWVELEVPAIPTRGRIGWAELQVPDEGGPPIVTRIIYTRRHRRRRLTDLPH